MILKVQCAIFARLTHPMHITTAYFPTTIWKKGESSLVY